MYALIFAIAISTAPDLMTMETFDSLEECGAMAWEVEQSIPADSDTMVFCYENKYLTAPDL